MTEGRLETESRCRECLAIIKGEVTSNNLSKRRVRTRTHGVVGGRGLVTPSYPITVHFIAENHPERVHYTIIAGLRLPFQDFLRLEVRTCRASPGGEAGADRRLMRCRL